MPMSPAFQTVLEQLYGLPTVAGYTRCYVRGCADATVISRVHTKYGRVDCCADHDPDRHGMARRLVRQVAVVDTPAPTVSAEAEPELTREQQFLLMFQALLNLAHDNGGPSGGQHAKLQRPVGPIAPSGDALVPPTWVL